MTSQAKQFRVPKHVEVRFELLDVIEEAAPGDRLPSEAELCERFGVSRITVRRAVDELVNEGMLVRRQGVGTFVAVPSANVAKENISQEIQGFYRQQAEAGFMVTSEVMEQRVIAASPSISMQLDLRPGAPVLVLKRKRMVNDRVHQYVVTYLDHEKYPDLMDTDFTHGSLYDTLRKHYGVRLYKNILTAQIVESDAEVSSALDIRLETSLLALDSIVYGVDGRPVASGRAYHAPGSGAVTFTLQAELEKEK